MLALLATIFPTIAGWINLVVGFFQNKEAQQTAATTAEANAEEAHEDDGSQSVADATSDDAQNAALNQIQQQLENPTPIVVVTTGVSK